MHLKQTRINSISTVSVLENDDSERRENVSPKAEQSPIYHQLHKHCIHLNYKPDHRSAVLLQLILIQSCQSVTRKSSSELSKKLKQLMAKLNCH